MTSGDFTELDEYFTRLQGLVKEFRTLWARVILFSWQWWLLVALIVLPWAFWIFFHRKACSDRLLYAAFFVMIISSFLDAIGSTYGLWAYYARVFPLMPPYLPWDTSLLPVAVMTFLQFKPRVHPLVKAAVLAAIAAFAMEPLAEWIGLYKPMLWKHYYSFPIFMLIYLIADWLSKRERFARLQGAG